jgi:Beta-lactamase
MGRLSDSRVATVTGLGTFTDLENPAEFSFMTSSFRTNSPGRRVGLTSAILILAALIVPAARSQSELPRATPESVGVSSLRLQRIGEAIQRHIVEHHIAGAVSLVARKGFVVHYEAHGVKDIESRKPMTRDSIFKMASSTKPVTGVAIMMLVEEGKIDLEKPQRGRSYYWSQDRWSGQFSVTAFPVWPKDGVVVLAVEGRIPSPPLHCHV